MTIRYANVWNFEDRERVTHITREQEAIPWCTTHNAQTQGEMSYCWVWDDMGEGTDADYCVISTGPPDHYWWKDFDGTGS